MGVKCTNSATDLGIDLSSNNCKAKEKRTARMKAAEAKADRIAKIKGASTRAHLMKTVSMAQAIYGTEAVAITPNQAEGIRRRFTSMLGHKRGMCNASLINIHEQDNPIAEIRWRQLKEWIALWEASPEKHAQIRKTWRATHDMMSNMDTTESYRNAIGPVRSMIAMLMEIGIVATEPDAWDTGRGRTWIMSDDPIDLKAFKTEFVQLVDEAGWSKAARHHQGKGMENGADFWSGAKAAKTAHQKG